MRSVIGPDALCDDRPAQLAGIGVSGMVAHVAALDRSGFGALVRAGRFSARGGARD